MENKIIITTYGEFNLVLDVEVLENNEYITEDFFNDYDFTSCGSWERVEYKAIDSLNEHIDGLVPIYYDRIDEQFNDLTDWRIDSLIEENCIEYRGDFSRFKQEVLFYDMYEVAYEELTEALENMEEEEIEEAKAEEVKEDIIEEGFEIDDLDEKIEFLTDNHFFTDRETFNSIFEDGRLLNNDIIDLINIIDNL